MKITEDDFSAWRENPVTEAVFAALKTKADEAKSNWLTASWDNGNIDPLVLADLRASAESWQYVIDIDHKEVEQILDIES